MQRIRKALLVIDMQNDFIDGSLGTDEAVVIVDNVDKKIKEYKAREEEVFYTQDTHYLASYANTQEGKNLPVLHCLFDTYGWQITDKIEQPDKNHKFIKQTFGTDKWKTILTDVMGNCLYDELELVGLCTDICVVSNAIVLKTMFPEVKIVVDASCCAGVTPEKHKAALETMKSCQIAVIGEEN